MRRGSRASKGVRRDAARQRGMAKFSHNYASLAAAIVNFKKETCQVPQERQSGRVGGGAAAGTCFGGVGEGVDNE